VNPVSRRIKKVINRSVLVEFFFYFLIAYAGYFSTFNHTANIILEREPLARQNIDFAIQIAVIAIITVLIESIPVNYIPFRAQVFYIFFKREECSLKENLLCTAIFIALTALVAIAYPEITQVLSILGGLCSVTISYLIPTYAYVKLSGRPLRSPYVMSSILFFGILITVGYFSVVVTFYEIITGENVLGGGHCQAFDYE